MINAGLDRQLAFAQHSFLNRGRRSVPARILEHEREDA